MESIISKRPPVHGDYWDYQCARCGSSCGYGSQRWTCLSSPEWCEGNPLPGRESIKRGEIEWYQLPEGK